MHLQVVNVPALVGEVPEEHRAFITQARIHHVALSGKTDMISGCMVGSIAAVLASADFGVPCLFQAGSMQWRCVSPEQDDGVSGTHFAFMWEPGSPQSIGPARRLIAFLQARQRGQACTFPGPILPEVHCWAVWPNTNQIVDLTTGDLPTTRERITGEPWLAARPPKYFIGQPEHDTCAYGADRNATALLFAFAIEMLKECSAQVATRFEQHVLSSADVARRLQRTD